MRFSTIPIPTRLGLLPLFPLRPLRQMLTRLFNSSLNVMESPKKVKEVGKTGEVGNGARIGDVPYVCAKSEVETKGKTFEELKTENKITEAEKRNTLDVLKLSQIDAPKKHLKEANKTAQVGHESPDKLAESKVHTKGETGEEVTESEAYKIHDDVKPGQIHDGLEKKGIADDRDASESKEYINDAAKDATKGDTFDTVKPEHIDDGLEKKGILGRGDFPQSKDIHDGNILGGFTQRDIGGYVKSKLPVPKVRDAGFEILDAPGLASPAPEMVTPTLDDGKPNPALAKSVPFFKPADEVPSGNFSSEKALIASPQIIFGPTPEPIVHLSLIYGDAITAASANADVVHVATAQCKDQVPMGPGDEDIDIINNSSPDNENLAKNELGGEACLHQLALDTFARLRDFCDSLITVIETIKVNLNTVGQQRLDKLRADIMHIQKVNLEEFQSYVCKDRFILAGYYCTMEQGLTNLADREEVLTNAMRDVTLMGCFSGHKIITAEPQ